MRRLIISTIVFLLPCILHAQDENPDLALADSYYSNGDYEQAITAYERAFATGGPGIKMLDMHRHAISLIELGRYDRACRMLESIVELEPDEAVAWFNLAIAHSRMDRYHNAHACFRRAAEIEPEWANAWYGTGLCELSLGHLSEAYAVIERLAPLDEDLAQQLLEAVIEEENYRNDPAEKE
jgi:tetratricopeptide (TPR) repeat protein